MRSVLMITSSFPRYEGDYFGPWILDYCRELKKQGVEVVVLAPKTIDNDPDILSEKGLTVKRFNYWWPRRAQKLVYPPGMIPQIKSNFFRFIQIPFLLYSYYQSAKNICAKKEIDIIHCQWVIPSGFIGAMLKRKIQKPLVITSQGAELFLSTKHPFSWATKLTIKLTDKLLPVSNQMSERAQRFGADVQNIKVVPNAVDTYKFRPDVSSKFREQYNIPNDAIVILTVRRLVAEKRVSDILEAFDLVTSLAPIHLIIAGDGPQKNHLRDISKNSKRVDQVHFIGFIDNKDLPDIYAASDIYILSSQQEGLSLSMLEAMSSELIVISTTSTGGNEVIDHQVNGYLYEIGDIRSLAGYINEAIELSAVGKSAICKKAREKVVDKYSLTKMVGQWLTLYNQLLT